MFHTYVLCFALISHPTFLRLNRAVQLPYSLSKTCFRSNDRVCFNSCPSALPARGTGSLVSCQGDTTWPLYHYAMMYKQIQAMLKLGKGHCVLFHRED